MSSFFYCSFLQNMDQNNVNDETKVTLENEDNASEGGENAGKEEKIPFIQNGKRTVQYSTVTYSTVQYSKRIVYLVF